MKAGTVFKTNRSSLIYKLKHCQMETKVPLSLNKQFNFQNLFECILFNFLLVSKESGHPVEWASEENYVFRLTEFKERLKKWLIENQIIQPKIFLNHMMKTLNENKGLLAHYTSLKF